MNSERNKNPRNPQNNLGLGERFRDYCSNYQPICFNYMATFVSSASTVVAISHYIDGNTSDATFSLFLGGLFGIL
ncbi:hypothetical protein J4205_01500 [Candidatus Pacearchaeota archaeon]|nr:hypothetical protein [Candidatus Pacearchaeota archaeon]